MVHTQPFDKSSVTSALLAATVLSLGLLSAHPAIAQGTQSCPASPPQKPPPPNLTPPAATLIPSDECEPAGFPGNPIAFFDDYSWRAFIALVWPAKAGQRGVPDANQPLGAANVPSVFETYKADWETFQQNAQPPTSWDSWSFNSVPCSNAKDIQSGDMVLASFNKMGNLGEAGVGKFVNVLIAQNTTYVTYLPAYNELQFNNIATKKLYIAANVPVPGNGPPVAASPIGAVTLKSSWIDMAGIAHPERFHTRTAWVKNIATGACDKKTVGLVGLHIVQKTPNRPQWIWSTFEQIDNVPGPNTPAKQATTFNNGNGIPMPTLGRLGPKYLVATAPQSPPPPFNVDRQTPINSSTMATNATWQTALEQQGSVWQFYQLTMTQWPVLTQATSSNPCAGSSSTSPECDGSTGNTFPGTKFGATSAFANTTLETFDQKSVFASCMACHNSTRTTDFVWSLPILATNPPNVAAATVTRRANALAALQSIIERSRQ